jgi:hypothetical protein
MKDKELMKEIINKVEELGFEALVISTVQESELRGIREIEIKTFDGITDKILNQLDLFPSVECIGIRL